MTNAPDSYPDEIATLKAALIAERAARLDAEAKAARATANMSSAEAVIAHQKLVIEKLKRELYGSRSERTRKLLDQMELELEEMEASVREDEIAAEMAAKASGATPIAAHTRKKPVRKPFPEHLPRERVIVPGPTACACCGSTRLAKLGEDITETLEVIPRQCWGGRPRRHRVCQTEVVADLRQRRPSVEQISRIGMDTSKHIFQLHGVNGAEEMILRKKLRRKEMVAFFEKLAPTVIAIEACGASHHWARLLQSFGHTVKLIAAQLVKPYVKRGKNDAADAEALCEAMSRPTMWGPAPRCFCRSPT